MAEHLEFPRPWWLMLTAGWNLAESLGTPGSCLSAFWFFRFFRVLRRFGLHVRFAPRPEHPSRQPLRSHLRGCLGLCG